MAKIVLTWELGKGFGHIAPLVALSDAFEAAGHETWLILRDVGRALQMTQHDRVLPAPYQTEGTHPDGPVANLARVTWQIGWRDEMGLRGRLAAWRNMFKFIGPDMVICDHSPTALLAARSLDLPASCIGSGFKVPPELEPIPSFAPRAERVPNASAVHTAEVLEVANRALEHLGAARIERFIDLFYAREPALLTYPEFDHYGAREGADYWGLYAPPAGADPVWPEGEGAPIFAYLKPMKPLRAMIGALTRIGAPTLIYMASPSKEVQADCERAGNIHLVDRPVDIAQVARTAGVAVSNANHATMGHLLALGGVPQFMIPLQAEQTVLTKRLVQAKLGMGVSTKRPKEFGPRLRRLREDREIAAAGKAFAERYGPPDADHFTARAQAWIERLLA